MLKWVWRAILLALLILSILVVPLRLRSFSADDSVFCTWPCYGWATTSSAGYLLLNIRLTNRAPIEQQIGRTRFETTEPFAAKYVSARYLRIQSDTLPVNQWRFGAIPPFSPPALASFKTYDGGEYRSYEFDAFGKLNATAGSRTDLYLRIVHNDWFVAALLSCLPVVWFGMNIRRHLTTRRAARIGLCTACGYDLRGTPTRCPECGKVIA